MTTLQMAKPVTAAALDTPEAQEARWIAWKSKGAAADRLTQRRTRIAFMAILIALACVTLAVMLTTALVVKGHADGRYTLEGSQTAIVELAE